MKLLGIRFCAVSDDAENMANCLNQLGLTARDMGDCGGDGFSGAVYPAGESWVEIWQSGEGMPAGTMLQLVVDDADAFAKNAKANGLEPQGPMDAHGERIYYLKAPGGLQLSFQSKLD